MCETISAVVTASEIIDTVYELFFCAIFEKEFIHDHHY